MAEEIAEKVKPVLIEVKEIISYVNNPEGELKKTIKNLEVLTRNLERTRGGAETCLLAPTATWKRLPGKPLHCLTQPAARSRVWIWII